MDVIETLRRHGKEICLMGGPIKIALRGILHHPKSFINGEKILLCYHRSLGVIEIGEDK